MNTTSLRSIQAVLAIGSFFLLTAAKGEGCGTSVIVEPPLPEPPPQMCPMGSHIVTICDDPVAVGVAESTTSSSSGGFGTGGSSSTGGTGGFVTTGTGPDEPPMPGSCHDECIPDDACPPGTVAQWACTNGGVAGPDDPVCEGDCPEPPPCQLICVPAECPPGMHNELICSGEGDVDAGSSSSSSSSSGSSSSGGSGGSGSGEELPYPGDCFNSCVPDQCPIGTVPVTTCVDGCDGMGTCTITCEPMVDDQGT